MKEKVLTNKKNGMLVLLLTIILYVVAASGVLVWAISRPSISSALPTFV